VWRDYPGRFARGGVEEGGGLLSPLPNPPLRVWRDYPGRFARGGVEEGGGLLSTPPNSIINTRG